MSLIKWTINHIAPAFIVTSPVTSYADQIWSIHKNRSSAGFSLDIPLIMLVSSITKYVDALLTLKYLSPKAHIGLGRLFYWFGAHYDTPLLIQALVMCVVQVVLLHVALQNRPPVGAQHSLNQPFAGAKEGPQGFLLHRPYDFWQWRNQRPYWSFLAYYTAALAILQLIIGPNETYVQIQGFVALGVEAILPIPQILENHRLRSSKGFRVSVLVNWLIGDAFKMTYFFMSEGGIPWAFKLCGMFQAACDCYLGVQYWMYEQGTLRADDGVAKGF
ncbi:hypothetical protein D0860_03452 [Hortaea werneckii]|uniref:PQ-loop repeat-containing protein 1 n=1 Tax=Hortaea werneckii TaxID=91943 RepID=A0A3M7HDW4_HORWE|nr:hypothetical protein D0860_03452 [Hortaea werneckii]RMZ33562.1 hypothetical protein D0859_02280 [Hortaea werneckii]